MKNIFYSKISYTAICLGLSLSTALHALAPEGANSNPKYPNNENTLAELQDALNNLEDVVEKLQDGFTGMKNQADDLKKRLDKIDPDA